MVLFRLGSTASRSPAERAGILPPFLNGSATRSCVLPVSAVVGADVMTIEGAAADLRRDVEMMREAWDRHQAKITQLYHDLETSRAVLAEREAAGRHRGH